MTNDSFPYKDRNSTNPENPLKDRSGIENEQRKQEIEIDSNGQQVSLENEEIQQETLNAHSIEQQIAMGNEKMTQGIENAVANEQPSMEKAPSTGQLKEAFKSIQQENNDEIVEKVQNSDATINLQDHVEKEKITNESSIEPKEQMSAVKNMHVMESIVEYEPKTAGFWIRFCAYVTDSLIVSAIVGILINPFFYIMDWDVHGSTWYAPITIITGIFYYAYYVLMTKFWQQTIGKMIFGLRVIPAKGEKLTWDTVLFRELVGRFISNTIFIIYVMVAFTPKNIGLHDYFADTYVIQEKVYMKNEKKIIKKMEVIDSIHSTV